MNFYKPSRNSKCLCGSGKKFKKCCANTYKTERTINSAVNAFNDERYQEALRLCRADITQYTIWYKNHTAPFINTGNEIIQQLLNVDIRALSSLVDLLFSCYEATDSIEEFPAVLNRLENNIDDPRWKQRLIYYQTLVAMGRDWDENAGREVLKQIEPIDQISDPEILQLYIDLYALELSFSRKLKLIEKTIDCSEKPIDRLHYRGVKGLELFLVGDNEAATSGFSQAIQEFRKEQRGSLTSYESFRLAMSLDFLGTFQDETEYHQEAINLYKAALSDEHISRSQKALLYKLIGDAWANQEDWKNAKESYLESLDFKEDGVARVFIARCYLELDNSTRALEYIESVNYDALDAGEKIDYAVVYSEIAVTTRDHSQIQRSSELLKNIKLNAPYFRELRDKLLLEMLQLLQNHEQTKESNTEAKNILLKIIQFVNRYMLLQPNFMGLGLNINKVIEDLSVTSTQVYEKNSE